VRENLSFSGKINRKDFYLISIKYKALVSQGGSQNKMAAASLSGCHCVWVMLFSTFRIYSSSLSTAKNAS
jgi:hypothetical protein